MRLQGRTDTLGSTSLSNPHRVLIVGCAYGGISTVVNLLEYSQGKARKSVYPGPDFKGARSHRGIEITVIDERDGYCESLYPTAPCRDIGLGYSAKELVLTWVLCSPRRRRAPRPCHTQVHEFHVEALQPLEGTEALQLTL